MNRVPNHQAVPTERTSETAPDDFQGALLNLGILQGHFLGASMSRRDTFEATSKMVDLLAFCALKRSLFLVSGFSAMVQDRNLVCAGALLRLQLDTALRFHAVCLVDDPEDFAAQVVAGRHVRDLRSRTGDRLTDRVLVESAAGEFPWVEDVYHEASGYVHFSEKHFWSAQSTTEPPNHVVNVEAASFNDAPENLFVEAITAFKRAAQLLDTYVARHATASRRGGAA